MFDVKTMLDSLAGALSETFWPTRCIGCDLPGTLLCRDCQDKLPYIYLDTACRHCAAPYGKLVCTECAKSLAHAHEDERQRDRVAFPFSAARAALSYEGLGASLITTYKDKGELRLDKLIASLICKIIRAQAPGTPDAPPCVIGPCETWLGWADALVTIPSRPEALRKRGFDHMQRVAELVSQWTSLPLICPLEHVRTVVDQRELGSTERMRNLSGSFKANGNGNLSGKRIILVDDILTTGATTSAATMALLADGAYEVRVAVAARVW